MLETLQTYINGGSTEIRLTRDKGSKNFEVEFIRNLLETVMSERMDSENLERQTLAREVHLERETREREFQLECLRLKDLMLVDQIKRRAPNEFKEHFLDEWATITLPNKLAEKIEEFEDAKKKRSEGS
ncbi:hypothetical protein TNCV_764301 [Trichonephila clavipes]|nr:hypothetical protein TNCV_764301 [Trichonephila clavipes]